MRKNPRSRRYPMTNEADRLAVRIDRSSMSGGELTSSRRKDVNELTREKRGVARGGKRREKQRAVRRRESEIPMLKGKKIL